MGIEKWSTTPANNATAGSVNFAENQAPSSVNDSARQLMADVKEWQLDAEWLKLGENGSANAYSISYVSATVFKFVGTDRRTLAPVGRRVKAGTGAGAIYGRITGSSLSASDTQITVAWDSGNLDASLSFVSLGILSPTSTSLPNITANPDASLSDVAITGLVTLTGGQVAFPATQVPSAGANTLDDYEEGTWTPVVGGNATYTTQLGVYTKVGNLVHVSVNLEINVLGTGGNNAISGLPFTSGAYSTFNVGYWANAPTTYVFIGGYTAGSSTTISLTSTGVAAASLGTGAVLQNGTNIIMSGSYFV